MQVEIFKKVSNYEDKDGNKKVAINLYLKVGDEFVPIEVRYFEDKKFDGKDPNYRARKLLLSAMAQVLPEKQKLPKNKVCPNCHKSMRVDDKDLDEKGNGTVWFVCDACGTTVISSTNSPDEAHLPEQSNDTSNSPDEVHLPVQSNDTSDADLSF